MSQNSQSADKSAAKKAAVLGTGKKKNPLNLILMIACAVLVLGGAALFLGQPAQDGETTTVVGAVSETRTGVVSYPESDFADGKCRFYEYRAEGGPTIRYFVLRSSDGVIRAAFDACDSCWHAGKGYEQEGDELVCRNCRQRFASVKVNELKGGCNPAPLAREVKDGLVRIRVDDIVAGRRYFDFKKEG